MNSLTPSNRGEPMCPPCVLLIKHLVIPVNLGVTPAERKKAQEITLNITIKFAKPPLACQTDKIEDALCYHKLTDEIREFCRSRAFNLIEYLGNELYKFIKNKIPQNCQLWLSVAKMPPIENLQNAVFCIGENHDNSRFRL